MIDPLEDTAFQPQSAEMAAIAAREELWLSELEQAQPSSATTADAQDLGTFGSGSGFFTLKDGERLAYSNAVRLRLGAGGRLLDERGRPVMGWSANANGRARPKPIEVPEAGNAFARYEVDERGLVLGFPVQSPASPKADPVPLARLCIAIFPAPQALIQRGDVVLQSVSAGAPSFFAADASNLGSLERQPTGRRMAAIRASARDLWIAGARAEMQVALSASRDALVRVALDVVK